MQSSRSTDVEGSVPIGGLRFDRGTLLLEGIPDALARRLPGVMWDPRVGSFRAPAWQYRQIVQELELCGAGFPDRVMPRAPAPDGRWLEIELRPYQQAALTAWELAGRRGIVALPTGSGKTRVAVAALAQLGQRALCLVPTRVLLAQWVKELSHWYAGLVGCFGDGERRVEPLTVCTFESARRHAARLGALFDVLVVDEAHHFGACLQDEALEMLTARFRLGLTATPPTESAQALRLSELLGPVVYQASIDDLAGTYLADYDLVVLRVHLNREEQQRYEREAAAFRSFYRAFRRMAPEASWAELVRAGMRSFAGRQALAAWRESQRMVAFPSAKRRALSELLMQHQARRTLIFTPNNQTAYEVSREHLVMPLTCDIQRAERDDALGRFRRGELRTLVSSRVLNEGLDVPDADVAIVVGGALGEREHIQRIGRLLRPRPGKRAIVYELVVAGTAEVRAAGRRRRSLVSHVTRGSCV